MPNVQTPAIDSHLIERAWRSYVRQVRLNTLPAIWPIELVSLSTPPDGFPGRGRNRQAVAFALRRDAWMFEDIAAALGYFTNGRPHAGTASHAAAAAEERITQTGDATRGSYGYRSRNRSTRSNNMTASPYGSQRVRPYDSEESNIPLFRFGIEFETTIPADDRSEVARLMMNTLGREALIAGYSGSRYNMWQLKTDGSVPDWNHGGAATEVVSRILPLTDDGITEMSQVADLLASYCEDNEQSGISRSCGMHVHIGVNGWTRSSIASLVGLYLFHQAEMESYLHHSRIDTGYARRIPMDTARNLVDKINRGLEAMTHHSTCVNTDHYTTRGTIEFRSHEGTISARKARTWVKFLWGLALLAQDTDPVELANGTWEHAGRDIRDVLLDAEFIDRPTHTALCNRARVSAGRR